MLPRRAWLYGVRQRLMGEGLMEIMMQRFVRVFGTVLGLLWSAYGVAVAIGMAVWPVVCRTDCQFNESLKLLLGEVAASRLIGGVWFACGIVFVVFINLQRRPGSKGGVSSRKRGRRR